MAYMGHMVEEPVKQLYSIEEKTLVLNRIPNKIIIIITPSAHNDTLHLPEVEHEATWFTTVRSECGHCHALATSWDHHGHR